MAKAIGLNPAGEGAEVETASNASVVAGASDGEQNQQGSRVAGDSEGRANGAASASSLTDHLEKNIPAQQRRTLESYLDEWKNQQALEQALCEGAENQARVSLGHLYKEILSHGMGKPVAILENWFENPNCMPAQLPLIIELLKYCPQDDWPDRWKQAAKLAEDEMS